MWRKINLFKEGKKFIWSDNWWLDNEDIWFVAGEINVLFHMKENEANFISQIPSNNICEFRKNPRCMKKGTFIFCFPDEGNAVWCYDLKEKTWKDVYINNPDGIRLSCFNMYSVRNKLYILSFGLKQIIEIEIDIQKINKYYDLYVKEVSASVIVDKKIYIVDSISNSILKFDVEDKTIKKYLLLGIDDYIKTISFDNNKFWLSGKKKKIYIWKENSNQIKIIDSFPSSFGIYNFNGKYQKLLNKVDNVLDTPLFLYSVFVGRYVWFIPFQTNEILYVDIDNYKINSFYLENEEQTDENIDNQLMGHKYILEYIKDNRYIGLFSLKNEWIFEIDAEKLTYKVLQYKLSKNSVARILGEFFINKNLLLEKEKLDLEHLLECIQVLNQKRYDFCNKKRKCFIGKNILYKIK